MDSRGEPASPPTDSTPMRSFNRAVYGYLGVIAGSVFVLSRLLGVLFAGVLVLGGHLLLHAPAFTLRNRTHLRHEESVEVVRDDLFSIRNPLTSMWIEDADVGELDSSRTRVCFTRSGPLGFSRRQYRLTMSTASDDTTEFELEREGTVLVTAQAFLEASEAGTRVEVTAERNRVHAFSLLLMKLLGPRYNRYLGANGYDVIREESSVGVRFL